MNDSTLLPHAGPEEVIRLKQTYLLPCVYHFYRDPPVIVAADGCELIDHRGRRYLDFYSGVTVMNAGHCNPEINAAAIEQINTLQHTTTIYLTEPQVRLAERLAGITPGRLRRSFFCTSGSEANEGAMLLACLHTGRDQIVALTDSLHGRTKWSMSVTGLEMWRTDPSPHPGVHFVPHPHCARCPLDASYPECGGACVDALEQCLLEAGPERVAAVIAEPIQGNGGIVVPPEDYWPRIREICSRRGVLLILDEVQTGMNRTGRWWACEHWGVVPDILTTAKALGNGFAIAAFITTDDIAAAYTRPGASTLGGNPVSARAALATIDYHERNGLARHAVERGDDLIRRLDELTDEFSCLRHVRGVGLMIGVDVVGADGEPDAPRLDAVLEELKDRGFFCGKTGRHRNVLTFLPPLTVEREQIDALLGALRTSLSVTEATE